MVKMKAKAGFPNQLVWHDKRNCIIARFVDGFCEVEDDIAVTLKKMGYSEVKPVEAKADEPAVEAKPKRGAFGK